jgi:capsular polysaccharide biosynthesis protein
MPRLPAPLRPLYPYLQPAFMHTSRLVAPVTTRLSRLAGGLVPAGIVATMEEAASTSGGTCVTARPPETIVRPPFLGWPADLPPLEPATDTVIPRLAVAELPGGRVLGRTRAVITGKGDLLWELSHYFGTTHPRQHPVFVNPFPKPPRDVAGRLGLLASRGDINYYHFLIDVLPRLGVLEQAEGIEMPDCWYVPAQGKFQRQFLELMGITDEKLVDSDENPHVRAECLVVPSLPSVVGEKNPPWVVEFLRRRLMGGLNLPQERRPIYITRTAGTNNRAVMNEPELLAFLTARGFDIIDPSELTVIGQMEAFAAASVIVSPHGAALANLVFASPGTTVIELFPPGSVLPDYWRLASSVPGLRYRYLSAWPRRTRRQGLFSDRGKMIVSDIEVDLAALTVMLDQLSD